MQRGLWSKVGRHLPAAGGMTNESLNVHNATNCLFYCNIREKWRWKHFTMLEQNYSISIPTFQFDSVETWNNRDSRRMTIMGSRKSTTWAWTIDPNRHHELYYRPAKSWVIQQWRLGIKNRSLPKDPSEQWRILLPYLYRGKFKINYRGGGVIIPFFIIQCPTFNRFQIKKKLM